MRPARRAWCRSALGGCAGEARVAQRIDDRPAGIMARLDRMQEDLTRRLDAEVVNFGAAEHAERIARGALDEVRALGEQVNALTRLLRRLEAEVRSLRGQP
jgi:hypothetical protein